PALRYRFFPKPLQGQSLKPYRFSEKTARGYRFLQEFMKKLSARAGLSKVYTNHCIRVTRVCDLDAAGHSLQDIMLITEEEWIAEVYTGNMQNAGTDARVFLALYGDLGKSEDIYLGDDDNKKDYFVKGKMDSFKLHLPAVGTPFKLRIGHDNSGVAAGWFLEKVVMQRPSTREAFEFRCDRWLAESEDDKSCIRELPALGSTVLESLKVHKYHVLVKTGKMRLAGTDANVYCNLFGNKSDTGNRPLKYSETNKDPFERKKEDLFTLEAIGLGDQIEKVRIGHDGTNPGAGWYLEKLTVWRDDQPDKKFEFVCDRNAVEKKDFDDVYAMQNEVHYAPSDVKEIQPENSFFPTAEMSYNVSVKTGDVAGAGTDANVFLTIFGKNGETGERQLRASDSALNKFERNRIDMFKIESPDIGEVTMLGKTAMIREGHGHRPDVPAVESKQGPAEGGGRTGDCRAELPAVGSTVVLIVHQSSTLLAEVQQSSTLLAEVQQSSTLLAEVQQSSTLLAEVQQSSTLLAEVQQSSTLLAEVQQSCTLLSKVQQSSTLLSKVQQSSTLLAEVQQSSTLLSKVQQSSTLLSKVQQSSTFTEVQKSSALLAEVQQSCTLLEVVAVLIIVIHNNVGCFLANWNGRIRQSISEPGSLERIRIRHDGSLPNSGWFLDWVRIAVPSRGKQYLFAAHRWLDTNEADRKLEIDIDCSEVTDIERTIPYEIIVQTGDCKGAGTDAAVFVQIYGEDGLKTDQTLLRSRSDNFEKGKEDRFKLDLIDVGPIQKIRIGHDGTGFGDGWFLEHVLIRRHALRGSRRLKLNRKSSSQARNRSLSLAQSQQLNRRKSFAAAAEPYKKDYYDDEDDEDEDGVVDLDEDDISSRKKTGARRPSVRPASAKKRRDSSPAGNTRSRSRSPYDEDNDLRLSIGDDDDDKDSRRDSRLRRRSSAVQSSKSHGRGRRPSPFDDEEDDSDIDGEDEAGDRASSRRGTLRRPSSSVGDRRRSSVKQAPLRSADNRKNFNDDDNFDDSDDDLPSSSRGKKPPSSSPSGRRYSTRPSRAALTDSLEDGDGRASRRSSVRPGSDALRRRANSMIPLRGQQRSLWRVDEESEGGFSIDDAEMDQDDLDTESLTSARALAQKRSASMVSPSGIGSRRRSTIGPARSGEGVAAGSQRQSIRRGDSIGDGSSDLTSADGFDGWSIVTAEEEIEEYWFYCKRWLAKDEDDKMIVRELLPTTKDGKPLSRLSEIVYEVRVKTGDKLGAGTDANVFITLYGAEADSGERELSKSESHRNKFENNNEDVFRLKAIDLGELRKLKIRHDDKGGGADWYLDHVIVADPKSKKEYYFPCNKWLSTSRDGGQISRDLIAVDKSHMGKNVNENLKLEKKAFSDTYHVKVFTGDVRGAGTDANCHIVLFGDSGDSGVIPLQQSKTHVNKFERNNCDEFEIELVDIGELHKIQIGHDNANPWPDWYLEKVEIDCPRLGMSWVFPCGEWIGKSKGDGQLDKTLYPQQGVTKIYANRVPYEITTYTSDKSGAGTSANVFIQIYSAETQTEQALLCSKNERSGKFKRGSVDKFVL
uniref:PLAT domain-containing protein n=1 Tax=Macrostomum lignano TaxID=282301 RepID=A0A1I8I840_9PLAT